MMPSQAREHHLLVEGKSPAKLTNNSHNSLLGEARMRPHLGGMVPMWGVWGRGSLFGHKWEHLEDEKNDARAREAGLCATLATLQSSDIVCGWVCGWVGRANGVALCKRHWGTLIGGRGGARRFV